MSSTKQQLRVYGAVEHKFDTDNSNVGGYVRMLMQESYPIIVPYDEFSNLDGTEEITTTPLNFINWFLKSAPCRPGMYILDTKYNTEWLTVSMNELEDGKDNILHVPIKNTTIALIPICVKTKKKI